MRLIEVITYEAAREITPSLDLQQILKGMPSWNPSVGAPFLDSLAEEWTLTSVVELVLVVIHSERKVTTRAFFRAEAIRTGNPGIKRIFMRPTAGVEYLESTLAEFIHRPLNGFLVLLCVPGCEYLAASATPDITSSGTVTYRFLQPQNL